MVRGAAVCACVVALIDGGAGARPNLVESALAFSQHGASLRVADVVRNVGTHTAPASTTGYYLGRIRIGGRAVTGLRPPGKLARLVAKSGTIWYPHARVNYEERELRKRYYPNRSVNRTGILKHRLRSFLLASA